MKKQLAFSLATLVAFVCLRADARPVIRQRCLTDASEYSQITVCSQEDVATGQSYGYSVYYHNGLLNESHQVLLGGTKSASGYSRNIYDGTLDWSNKLLRVNDDGSGSGGFPGGGVHERIELYFQIPYGHYDSNYGSNYAFQF